MNLNNYKLHIVLRTHDGKNIHGKKLRYINVSKKELIVGCVSSLVNSANLAKNCKIKFTVLDDHSSKELLNSLHDIFSYSIHPYTITSLSESGFNHSAYMQFKTCRDSDSDLIYSVEDDYLHCPSAIGEMLSSHESISKKFGLDQICIFPFDTPQEYDFNLREKFFVVREKFRHWKSSSWTTQTFLTSPKVLKEHWGHFEKLALEFKVVPRHLKHILNWDEIIWEDTTICNVWRDYVPVFHPIPSLALHVQYEKEMDVYIDHEYWWNNFTKINKSAKVLYL